MNRKSILISFGVTYLAVLAGYGVSKTVSDDTDLEILTLGNVEALADGEKHEHNGFWLWFSQGLLKNEEEMREQCPTESNSSGKAGAGGVSVEGSVSTKNPSARTDIRCKYGYDNCSRVRC
ncbi:NVEALA domain-containing protein [Capnocytophaga canis]|uniref:NVEALA domain-containing protein n=1 Tax=Capnocytophaga canis TaxID=1848903 RepID=UPI00370D6BFC